ncbi:putative ankyrin repeat domain-containing protein 1, partial [Scophthalmus maximus]
SAREMCLLVIVTRTDTVKDESSDARLRVVEDVGTRSKRDALYEKKPKVTGKRSEGKEADDFQAGVYEAAVNQEKRDDRRSHGELGGVGGALSEESDSGGEQEQVSVAALNTDKSGRLKLETVDDLFNILQLRKRRRERKTPVRRKQQPEPETVPETVDEQLFLTAAMENKLPVVEKFLRDGGNPNVSDHFQRSALHKASFRGNTDVMKRLLEAGAAIEKKDK